MPCGGPGQVFTSEVAGESVLVVRDRSGERTASSTSAGTGARVCALPRATMPVPPSAARTTAGPTGSTASCWPHPICGRCQTCQKEQFGLHEVAVNDVGRLPVGLSRRRRRPPLVADRATDPPAPRVDRRARCLRAGESRCGPDDRLRRGGNWKALVENFTECYHCPSIHPELTAAVPEFRLRLRLDLGRPVARGRSRRADGGLLLVGTGGAGDLARAERRLRTPLLRRHLVAERLPYPRSRPTSPPSVSTLSPVTGRESPATGSSSRGCHGSELLTRRTPSRFSTSRTGRISLPASAASSA